MFFGQASIIVLLVVGGGGAIQIRAGFFPYKGVTICGGGGDWVLGRGGFFWVGGKGHQTIPSGFGGGGHTKNI